MRTRTERPNTINSQQENRYKLRDPDVTNRQHYNIGKASQYNDTDLNAISPKLNGMSDWVPHNRMSSWNSLKLSFSCQ
jgi:hypothetical protein